MKNLIKIAALSALSITAHAQQYIAAYGDEMMLRTDYCLATDTRQQCETSHRLVHGSEFVGNLANASQDGLIVAHNYGMAGDTCLPGATIVSGPFKGEMFGLLQRVYGNFNKPVAPVTMGVVMIGANDLANPFVKPETVANCVSSVWFTLLQKGLSVTALTYPTNSGKVVELNGLLVKKAAELNTPRFKLVRLDDGNVNTYANSYNMPDGVHPSPTFARDIAAKISREVK